MKANISGEGDMNITPPPNDVIAFENTVGAVWEGTLDQWGVLLLRLQVAVRTTIDGRPAFVVYLDDLDAL